MLPQPSRGIRDADRLVQWQRGNPFLVLAHAVKCPEPAAEGRSSLVKNGASGDRALIHRSQLCERQVTCIAYNGLKTFRLFRAEANNDLQRAKSPTFSVTSVAPARTASTAISKSRKWRTNSICPKVPQARRNIMPISI